MKRLCENKKTITLVMLFQSANIDNMSIKIEWQQKQSKEKKKYNKMRGTSNNNDWIIRFWINLCQHKQQMGSMDGKIYEWNSKKEMKYKDTTYIWYTTHLTKIHRDYRFNSPWYTCFFSSCEPKQSFFFVFVFVYT